MIYNFLLFALSILFSILCTLRGLVPPQRTTITNSCCLIKNYWVLIIWYQSHFPAIIIRTRSIFQINDKIASIEVSVYLHQNSRISPNIFYRKSKPRTCPSSRIYNKINSLLSRNFLQEPNFGTKRTKPWSFLFSMENFITVRFTMQIIFHLP